MRKLILLTASICMFSLTGCINEYEYTEQQSDSAAEYMADLLLKENLNYKPSLTPVEELNIKDPVEEEDTSEISEKDTTLAPTPVPEQEEEDKNQTPVKEYTLTEVIGEQDFEIEYKDYKISDTYSEGPYFSLDAREDNQLLVTTFSVKNISDKEKTLSLSKSDVLYQLDVNVGTVYKPLLTLLENDLQYIELTLGAGKTETVVLVFEVSKRTDISDINLIASREGRTEIIEIK